MTILEQKLDELQERLMAMAATVEEMVTSSVRALVERNHDSATRVVDIDEPKVNRLENEIEDAAINLMALHQPEASNLRAITMIIKLNKDLERIGDHAVNIADAARYLIDRPELKRLNDLPRMAEHAVAMLRDALAAFTNKDPALARAVCERDAEVDALRDQIYRELVTHMTSDATTIDRALKLMLVSMNVERIADLATNIAEDAVYMAEGRVIMHHADEQPAPE